MRLVIVGATGNVGSSLVEVLSQDEDVTSIVGIARRLPDWHPPKTEWVAADISRDDLTPHLRGADAVVHLAWLLQPSHDPVLTWNTNVKGSARVFRAVADVGVPCLVYGSSVGAYSPGPREPVDESWPTDGWPTAAYSREKAYVERLLDLFELRNREARVVRFRPGFMFKHEAAAQQRRLFAGPLVPGKLARASFVPAVPDLPGLRLQVLHTADAAEAYRSALKRSVSGAFNLAAEPVLDTATLADAFAAKRVRVPPWAARLALSTTWHLHALPAPPYLFDYVLQLPLMSMRRAHDELHWQPRHTSVGALQAFVRGLQSAASGPTPPLSAEASGSLRSHEFETGVGARP